MRDVQFTQSKLAARARVAAATNAPMVSLIRARLIASGVIVAPVTSTRNAGWRTGDRRFAADVLARVPACVPELDGGFRPARVECIVRRLSPGRNRSS